MSQPSSLNRCLICYKSYQLQVHLSPNGHEKLKNQLPTIFLLTKLFSVPNYVCGKLLSSNGNPSTWALSVCTTCSEFVEKAKHIHDQQLHLENAMNKLRVNCKSMIVRSFKTLKRSEPLAKPDNFKVLDYIRDHIASGKRGRGRPRKPVVINSRSNFGPDSKVKRRKGTPRKNSSNVDSSGMGRCTSNESLNTIDNTGMFEIKLESDDEVTDFVEDDTFLQQSPRQKIDDNDIEKAILEDRSETNPTLSETGPAIADYSPVTGLIANNSGSHLCDTPDVSNEVEIGAVENVAVDPGLEVECNSLNLNDSRLLDQLFLFLAASMKANDSTADLETNPMITSTITPGQSNVQTSNDSKTTKNGAACPHCFRQFESASICATHVAMAHTGARSCTKCNETFPNHASWVSHMKVHSSNVSMCERCPKICRNLKQLVQHQAEFHGMPLPEGFVDKARLKLCSFCGMQLAHQKSLTRHIASVHRNKGEEKPFKCPLCPYRAFHRYAVKKHKKYVHEKCPYPKKPVRYCPECGQRFRHTIDLNRHLSSEHGGSKPDSDDKKIKVKGSDDQADEAQQKIEASIRSVATGILKFQAE